MLKPHSLLLASLPLACPAVVTAAVFLSAPAAFAQTTPSSPVVKEQNRLVREAAANLKTLLGNAAAMDGDKTLLAKIAGLSVKSDLSNLTQTIAVMQEVSLTLSERLDEIRQKRDALARHLATLTAYTKHPAYVSLVDDPTRNDAVSALSEGNTELKRESYYKPLGETSRPGEAIAALVKVYTTLTAAADLSVLGVLAVDPVEAEIADKLAGGLPAFVKAQDTLKKVKGLPTQVADLPINRLLPSDANSRTALNEMTDKVTALGKRADDIAAAFTGWFQKLNGQTEKRSLLIVGKGNDVRRRKPAAHAFAHVEKKAAEEYIAKFTKLLFDWDNAKALLVLAWKKPIEDADAAVTPLKATLIDLTVNAELLTSVVQNSNMELVTIEVRLSFFPDVSRLIRILNPTARLIDPTSGKDAGAAVQKRSELRQKEAALLEARGKVADVKTRIQRIEAELAQAQAAASRTTDMLNKVLGQQEGLTNARLKLEKALEDTKDADQRTKLQSQLDGVKEKETIQKKAVTAAETDKTAADTRLKTLSDEKEGLPFKRAAEEVNLKTEETALNELRRDLPGLALDESDAFAAARDNAPFFVAEPIFDDPDPVRRIFIWGDPASRTLYLRGSRDDVRAARDTVAEFDKPAPQTRLSFYTLQLSGEDKAFGLEKGGGVGENAKTAFTVIEENLDAARIGTKLVMDAMREAVADTITEKSKNVPTRMARYDFYSNPVRRSLGFNTLAGGSQEFPDVAAVTRYTLPDPVRLTTLGELIFILSLGGQKARETVRDKFAENIAKQLNQGEDKTNLTPPAASSKGTTKAAKDLKVPEVKTRKGFVDELLRAALGTVIKDDAGNPLAWLLNQGSKSDDKNKKGTPPKLNDMMYSLLRIMGLGLPEEPAATPAAFPDDAMTPQQKEILDALLAKARTDVAGTVYNLTRQLDDLPEELRYQNSPLAEDLREQYLPLIGWLVSDPNNSNRFPNAASWRDIGLLSLMMDSTSLPGIGGLRGLETKKLQDMDRMAFEIAKIQYIANPLSKATGRIEAADLMIRDLIDGFDDDLKRRVRLPAMENIRNEIRTKLSGVSFGGVEETSFLATNRRVARVDPVGSQSLTVEEKANFAEAAQNLSSLLTQQQERDKTRDGILGAAATAIAASETKSPPALTAGLGLTSLLGSLFGPTDNSGTTIGSETYSVSSGNLYKITPIFGPSGQGMRFNFDFVATTRLREPGGTTNPAIPRIERHTINTEVAIANLEMRTITSFDSNYQLGLPPKKSGGLPFFNAIPGLKEIPLLGYFSLREGQPAQRQKSVIMAHTVMYPTIADIAGLMLDAAALPVTFSPEPPAASRQLSETNPFIEKFPVAPEDFTYGETVSVTVKLRRPVRRDSRLLLEVVSGVRLEVVSPEMEIQRGQDTAVFHLRIPVPANPDSTTAAQKKIEAEEIAQGAAQIKGAAQMTKDLRAFPTIGLSFAFTNKAVQTAGQQSANDNLNLKYPDFRRLYDNFRTSQAQTNFAANEPAKQKAAETEVEARKKLVTAYPVAPHTLVVRLRDDSGRIEMKEFVINQNISSQRIQPKELVAAIINPAGTVQTALLDANGKPSSSPNTPIVLKAGERVSLRVGLTPQTTPRPWRDQPVLWEIDAPHLEQGEKDSSPLRSGETRDIVLRAASPDNVDDFTGTGYIIARTPQDKVSIPFHYKITANPYSVRKEDFAVVLEDANGNPLRTEGGAPFVEAGKPLTVRVTFRQNRKALAKVTSVKMEMAGQIDKEATNPNYSRVLDSRDPDPLTFQLNVPADWLRRADVVIKVEDAGEPKGIKTLRIPVSIRKVEVPVIKPEEKPVPPAKPQRE